MHRQFCTYEANFLHTYVPKYKEHDGVVSFGWMHTYSEADKHYPLPEPHTHKKPTLSCATLQ